MKKTYKIILESLGGLYFVTKSQAYDFATNDTGTELAFKLPVGMAKDKINRVKINRIKSRMEKYEYMIEFGSKTGDTYKMVNVEKPVYNDTLQLLFTMNTGLNT